MHSPFRQAPSFALISVVALFGCSSPSSESAFQFDNEVTIITQITSSGGALGDEAYRLSAKHGDRRDTFFEGTNPRKFAVYRRGTNQIAVRFCDGNVQRAQPIFLPTSEERLIRLHVELDCAERVKESQ